MRTNNINLAIIGGGNMGAALAGGLLPSNWKNLTLRIVETDAKRCTELHDLYPSAQICTDATAALQDIQIVIFAIKPQIFGAVAKALANSIRASQPLVISIAAGIRIQTIEHWLGSVPIIRCMPNTPAVIRKGITAMFANTHVRAAQRELAERVITSVGAALWLDKEDLIDAVTAVSGSGPAYFFYVMEAMTNAAVKLGLSKQQAEQLIKGTALGATALASTTQQSFENLRAQVTSKGGTTAQAIHHFDEHQLAQIIEQAMHKAWQRSRELSDEFSKS